MQKKLLNLWALYNFARRIDWRYQFSRNSHLKQIFQTIGKFNVFLPIIIVWSNVIIPVFTFPLCLLVYLWALIHWEKIPIKITLLAQYSCSIFIFLFILYRRIVKNMVLSMKFYTSLCKFSPPMVYHIYDYSTT